jgi:hypothetical protein
MVDNGFQYMLLVSSDIEDLIYQMKNYMLPTVEKWINKETT